MILRLIAFGIVAMTVSPPASSQQPVGATMSQKKFAISKENIRELVPPMGAAFATDRIMIEGKKVGYMYRETTKRQDDSGWRFFSGDEDQTYT